jgi:hypothetical protein
VNEQPNTKTCPVCFEQIDARARNCRCCGQPQGGIAGWFARHSAVGWIPPFVIALAWLLIIGVALGQLSDRGEPFARHQDKVTIISSKMHLQESEEGPTACVIGEVRNDSEIDWKEMRFEVQFFDEAGELGDVARRSQSPYEPPVAAHSTAGFKLTTPLDFARERYTSHKVFVRYARDARAR